MVVDLEARALADFVCGANRDGFHYRGVNWERDLAADPARIADIRNVSPGDPAPGGQGERWPRWSRNLRTAATGRRGLPIAMLAGLMPWFGRARGTLYATADDDRTVSGILCKVCWRPLPLSTMRRQFAMSPNPGIAHEQR